MENPIVDGFNDIDADFLKSCTPIEEPPPPYDPTTDIDDKRLIIYKIVTTNFKSYACRKELGPFHKNFSCIIGPNGSGKSNVIDSLLFVFGFRSQKIRSKKISTLIHKSERFPNLPFCSVEVHFKKIIDIGDGAHDYNVVPDSEFCVVRNAYQDNSSTYLINEKKANFKDVTTFLRSNGVDLDHNRFLILQGEVEQISLMKPKAPSENEDGFLEYLEDIIGSSRFAIPLKVLDERIEKIVDIKQDKLARVKAIEQEKNDLQGIRDEAIEYLKKCNVVVEMKNMMYQKEINERNKIREKIMIDLKNLEASVKEIRCSINTEKSEVGKIKVETEKVAGEFEAVSQDLSNIIKNLKKYEDEDVKYMEERSHCSKVGRDIVNKIKAEEKKLNEFTASPEDVEKKKEELKSKINELKDVKKIKEETMKDKMKDLEKKTDPLKKKCDDLEKELESHQNEANKAKSEHAIFNQQFEIKLSSKNREMKKYEDAQRRLESATHSLEACQQTMKETDKSLNSTNCLQKQLQNAERDWKQVTETESKLAEKIGSLKAQLSDLNESISYKGTNKVLGELLKAKSLQGILGRLGDLAWIPPQYDVALSTACGPLDNVVVETMDQAKAAVEYLKRHGIGQATFIALDKMEKFRRDLERPFTPPRQDTPRLFDLISTDVKVKCAFYYALRDTLVAPSLEIATETTFKGNKRYRVVSLKGELVEISGAMSGGGCRPISGRICTSEKQVNSKSNRKSTVHGDKTSIDNETRMKIMEEELRKNLSEYNAVVENKQKLEEAMNRIRIQINDHESNLTRCRAEIPRYQRAIEMAKKESEEYINRAKACGPSDEEIKKSKSEIEKLLKQAEKKQAIADKILVQIKSNREQIDKFTEETFGPLTNSLKEIEKKIEENTKKLNKLEVDISARERSKAQCEKKLEQLMKEKTRVKEQFDEYQRKLAEIEEKSGELCKQKNELKEREKELEKKRDECSSNLADRQKILNDLCAKEDSEKRAFDNVKAKVQENDQIKNSWLQKQRQLQLHKIEDEDQVIVGLVEQISEDPNKIRKFGKNGLEIFKPEDVESFDVTQEEIDALQKEIDVMSPNLSAIEVYRTKMSKYLTRVNELNYIKDIHTQQKEQRERFKNQRHNEFMNGFNKIKVYLKEIYQMITLGGDAELEMQDSMDPFSEGIVFSVRPPKKSWKNISNLSGGEKTLSSLSLVFALHKYRPTPLYVMDEIDAALDFKNVSIVGNYIKEQTKNAQFVVISLRNNMFELADRLVGIYKVDNITYNTVIDPFTIDQQIREHLSRRESTKAN